jgi:hypothetical protein
VAADIEDIRNRVLAALPTATCEQLVVTHPGADDDGLWFFRLDEREVQIEAPEGNCPFLVESHQTDERYVGTTPDDVVARVLEWLRVGA